MKQIFVCERCGKNFESEEAALKCEQKHQDADEMARKLAEEKQTRAQEINDAEEHLRELKYAFMKDYEVENVASPFYRLLFR
jgi:uncharacterized membrane protein